MDRNTKNRCCLFVFCGYSYVHMLFILLILSPLVSSSVYCNLQSTTPMKYTYANRYLHENIFDCNRESERDHRIGGATIFLFPEDNREHSMCIM